MLGLVAYTLTIIPFGLKKATRVLRVYYLDQI